MASLLDSWADRQVPTVWEPAPIYAEGQEKPRPPALPHFVPGDDFKPGVSHNLLLYAGSRGSGKTEHASRYFCKWMNENPGHRGRIIGPTLGDVIESCVNGPSGIRAMDPTATFYASAPGGASVKWDNGSVAVCLGTMNSTDIERFRATGNRHIDWWEELAACGRDGTLLRDAWDQAKFGLRLGTAPHSIASTTPKSHGTYAELHKSPMTYRMVGTLMQNPHLPEEFKAELVKRYEGTRIGRQELYGELLEDAEGALWLTETIENVMRAPDDALIDMKYQGRGRTIVAVDPSVGAGEPDSDECGIIVGCVSNAEHETAWILDDRSVRADPMGWALAVRSAFHDWSADYVVVETNQGGSLVTDTLGRYAPEIPVRKIWAKKGKALRADPVAVMSEQGRVRLLVKSAKLEEQMTGWEPLSNQDSPDRLDAFVYCVLSLLPRGGPNQLFVEQTSNFRRR